MNRIPLLATLLAGHLIACHDTSPPSAPVRIPAPAPDGGTAPVPAPAAPSAAPQTAPLVTASGTDLPAADWQKLALTTMTIHFPASMAEDAERFRQYVESFRAAVGAALAGFDTDATMRDPLVCNLYLVPVTSSVAGPGHARSRTSVGGGRPPLCDIFMLPSTRIPEGKRCCTNAREPFDHHYDQRVLGHEYAGVLLDRLNMAHAGWAFHDAPGWFVQGFEEYLAVTLSSEHTRKVTLEAYRAIVASDPARVSSRAVKSGYVDGTVLHQFLRAEFGAAKVQAVLVSKETSFQAALKRELGVTHDQLFARWDRWRTKGLGTGAKP
jgi:hypothetical protein